MFSFDFTQKNTSFLLYTQCAVIVAALFFQATVCDIFKETYYGRGSSMSFFKILWTVL